MVPAAKTANVKDAGNRRGALATCAETPMRVMLVDVACNAGAPRTLPIRGLIYWIDAISGQAPVHAVGELSATWEADLGIAGRPPPDRRRKLR